MKVTVGILVLSLSIAPQYLIAQTAPPWEEQINSTSALVDQEANLVSSPSPPEAEDESDVSCGTEPVVTLTADSNETDPEIMARYSKAHRLLGKGAWRQAGIVLKNGLIKFPESRHLRMLNAELLWYLSGGGKDRKILEQSAQEAVRAMEIGFGFNIVDYSVVDRLSETLGRTGDADTFERLFAQALLLDPSPVTHRHYALGLSRMKSPKTEEAFKAAIALEDEGAAHAYYGEWLFDRHRSADALDMLPQAPKQIYYLHFLRGLALERSGRLKQARKSYDAFRDFSASFPAPARFRIKGSNTQRDSGIHFDDEAPGKQITHPDGTTSITENALTNQQGINGISYMLYGEAVGENYGGKLAVGWVARTRVLRGTAFDNFGRSCPLIAERVGSTLSDWYKIIICQDNGGAFNGRCAAWCSDPNTTLCRSDPDTNSAAYDVFYGYKADPVSTHCPGGVTQGGNYCSAPFKTCAGSVHSYLWSSPLFHQAAEPGAACPTHMCAPSAYGKVCANGGKDHCFYGTSQCIGPGRYGYDGTITAVGASMVTPAYYHDGRTTNPHKGHLEGPETGVNFDIYLQRSSSASGPWADVAWTRQPSAIEDVDYTTSVVGYYRWRIVSVSGTGYWFACTRRP